MEKKELKTCLYLDDVRTPTKTIPGYEAWNIVRSYDEFVAWIKENGIPDYISFDHDLADSHYADYASYQAQGIPNINYEGFQEKTGWHCIKWLCDHVLEEKDKGNELTFGSIGVHSMNPMGGYNIEMTAKNFCKHMGWTPVVFRAKPEFKIEDEE